MTAQMSSSGRPTKTTSIDASSTSSLNVVPLTASSTAPYISYRLILPDTNTISGLTYTTNYVYGGSLTTPFSAPSGCSSLTFFVQTVPIPAVSDIGTITTFLFNNLATYAYEAMSSAIFSEQSSFFVPDGFHLEQCYPTSFWIGYAQMTENNDISVTEIPYYSPAVCPQGWPAYPISTDDWAATSSAVCCPPKYQYYPISGNPGCFSDLREATIAYRLDDTGIPLVTINNTGLLVTAEPLHIRWNAKDRIRLPIDMRIQPPSSDKPSGTKIIAIAVSIPLLVLLAIGIGGYFLLRRMRRRRQPQELEAGDPVVDKPELDGISKPLEELSSNDFTMKVEMNGESFPELVELDGTGLMELGDQSVLARGEEESLEKPPLDNS